MAKKTQNIKRELYEDEALVSVFLPMVQDEGSIRMNQTENVTINGKTTKISRGVQMDVTIPVYEALTAKYPELLTR